MSDISVGDVVQVKTEPGFSLDDAGANPADPSTVTLTWYVRGDPPTVWTYGVGTDVVRDQLGVFHADIPIAKRGKYFYRWAGVGAVTAAEEGSFEVKSDFAG